MDNRKIADHVYKQQDICETNKCQKILFTRITLLLSDIPGGETVDKMLELKERRAVQYQKVGLKDSKKDKQEDNSNLNPK